MHQSVGVPGSLPWPERQGTRIPPLEVRLLFHPRSPQARALASGVLQDWMGIPALQGLRVPVFFGEEDGGERPPEPDFDRAQHTLAVLLVDGWMSDWEAGAGHAWATWLSDLAAAHPPGGRHHLMPVALDEAALVLSPELGKRHFLSLSGIVEPDRRQARLSFGMSVSALHLLRGEGKSEAMAVQAPVTLFVSHAKKDLDPGRQDAVRFTQDALQDLPVHEWFDARNIREGAAFEEEIRNGLRHADGMIVFLTDAWATRPWCRTEALIAKELGTPIVVVDALMEGEPRSFPYSGNTRLLRWRPSPQPPEGGEAATLLNWQERSRTEGERIIAAAVREALRGMHARRWLEGIAGEGDVVLEVAPEPARVGSEPPLPDGGPGRGRSFLYPDPPVGLEEQRLLARIWPRARFETPMMRLAGRLATAPAEHPFRFAVSVSESPDLTQHGLTVAHQRLLTDEVHLYLMLAGLQIVYGGKLDADRLDDPDNFTVRLFQLARGYSGLAADAGVRFAPIVNAAPWPLWKLYGPELNAFAGLAKLERVPRPDFGPSDAELGALANGFVPASTPLQLYAWARALTAMRDWVTAHTAARLCVGGRIEGFKGRMPGLVEEPLLSLRVGKPLFLVGALGGCTKLVIDLLEQRHRHEMTEEEAKKNVAGHVEILALYERYGGEPAFRDRVAEELRSVGSRGPAAALRNGLDDEENRELFATADAHRIATLVLTGLERLQRAGQLSPPQGDAS